MLAGMYVSSVDGGIIVCSRDEEIPRWRHLAFCLALAWGLSLGKKCAEDTSTSRQTISRLLSHLIRYLSLY